MGHLKDVEPRRALKGLTAGDAIIPSGKFCSIFPSSFLATYMKYLYINIRKLNYEAPFSVYISDDVVPLIFLINFKCISCSGCSLSGK
jgi:hypothetical protein